MIGLNLSSELLKNPKPGSVFTDGNLITRLQPKLQRQGISLNLSQGFLIHVVLWFSGGILEFLIAQLTQCPNLLTVHFN